MHYSHPLFTHLPYLALGHARATDKRLRALLLLLLSDPVEDRCRLLLLLAHLGVNREGLGWTTSAVTSNGIIISWGQSRFASRNSGLRWSCLLYLGGTSPGGAASAKADSLGCRAVD